MKRRSFLQTSAALSAPILINGIPINAVARNSFLDFVNPDNDKILVLIQLSGGSDGLNCVLPLDQYSNLDKARNKIIIKESLGLKLSDKTALHPSMSDVKSLYDSGNLSLIHSVGYPNQNRSHFRSTDIWTSGSAADKVITTGWLGRYYDSMHPSYPTGYPNSSNPDPLAITVGGGVSQTCQGPVVNFSLAINNPDILAPIPESEINTSIPNTNYGKELRYIMTTLQQYNDYSDVIKNGYGLGGGTIPATGNALLDRLNIVAQLINGGMKTKVYVVNLNGFDTHSNQCDPDDHELGTQADLLSQLSGAMKGFQDLLIKYNLDKRVIGMTFSEFGRRIKANDSTGTDHGSAAPLFLFGSCIKGGMIGQNPTISDNVGNDEGVAMQNDFRSVYASLLIDWFQLDSSLVKQLLYEDFQKLPIIEGCVTTSILEDSQRDFSLNLSSSPNPADQYTILSFDTKDEFIRIKLYDSIGSEIKEVYSGNVGQGHHELRLDTSSLHPGNYVVRISSRTAQMTKLLSVLN
ncbi:MAG: DUF1501 domain-containing protein [Saprospiraceae bacterium]|nr:DUF1501 domain-containing protein [Saprospiraceae bacterium]